MRFVARCVICYSGRCENVFTLSARFRQYRSCLSHANMSELFGLAKHYSHAPLNLGTEVNLVGPASGVP